MPSCAIANCKLRSQVSSKTKGAISFHRFPKEPEIRLKWIEATGREDWMPTMYSTICSKHFREKDFAVKKSGNKYLMKNAIPRERILICASSSSVVEDATDVSDTDINKHIQKQAPTKQGKTTRHQPASTAVPLPGFDSDTSDEDDTNLDLIREENTLQDAEYSSEIYGFYDECEGAIEVAVSTGQATASAAPRTACANCGGDASGLQWWCVSLGYRECAECATRDSTGYWLRAPEGRPEGEVAALIAALRRELNLFRSIKEEPAEIPVELDEPGVTDDGAEPEILVKEEPKEEPDDDPLSLNLESNPLVLCPREQSEHVVPHSKAAPASRKRKAPEQATPRNDPVDRRPQGPPADPTPHSATSIYLKPEATTLQRLSQTAIPTHSLDPRPSPSAVISSMAHTQQSGTQKKQPRRTK